MSLPVRVGLFNKLKGTSAITNLVGERIFYEKAPDETKFPYVIFSKVDGTKVRTMNTPEAFKKDTWLVKAIDRSSSSNLAEEVASAVDSTLDGGTLTVSGKIVADLYNEGDIDYLEESGDQQYRHSGANYRIVLTAP